VSNTKFPLKNAYICQFGTYSVEKTDYYDHKSGKFMVVNAIAFRYAVFVKKGDRSPVYVSNQIVVQCEAPFKSDPLNVIYMAIKNMLKNERYTWKDDVEKPPKEEEEERKDEPPQQQPQQQKRMVISEAEDV